MVPYYNIFGSPVLCHLLLYKLLWPLHADSGQITTFQKDKALLYEFFLTNKHWNGLIFLFYYISVSKIYQN